MAEPDLQEWLAQKGIEISAEARALLKGLEEETDPKKLRALEKRANRYIAAGAKKIKNLANASTNRAPPISLSGSTAAWMGLAAFQTIICILILDSNHGNWFYFIEPILVAAGAIIVQITRSHGIAGIMLAYAYIGAFVGFMRVLFGVIESDFTWSGIFESLHQLKDAKEFAELMIIQTAQKSFDATKVR